MTALNIELNEKWDNGELGCDEQYVEIATSDAKKIDEIAGIQEISIRFPKELLQDLKDIAQIYGIGYQPLIKQILGRFVDAEKKMIANQQIQATLLNSQNNQKSEYQKIA